MQGLDDCRLGLPSATLTHPAVPAPQPGPRLAVRPAVLLVQRLPGLSRLTTAGLRDQGEGPVCIWLTRLPLTARLTSSNVLVQCARAENNF